MSFLSLTLSMGRRLLRSEPLGFFTGVFCLHFLSDSSVRVPRLKSRLVPYKGGEVILLDNYNRVDLKSSRYLVTHNKRRIKGEDLFSKVM